MRVREFIADSRVTEGAARGQNTPPRVSVVLPTFRRGDSGLLSRAIESILASSLRDLELIIVDDASTDSTAAVIADVMQRDDRVSVVRHARNIGLPAISEFEGYRIARGDRIAFAFDDTTFAHDALERLLAASDERADALIVGWVDVHVAGGAHGDARVEALGRGEIEEHLQSRNVIANSAVMAPRALFEVVGLYDPHVALARVCDYDLWQRARRRAAVHFIDVRVGEEFGPATTDSLGSTYPLDQWAADDRMRLDRDQMLRPECFAEIDVFDAACFSSARTRSTVTDLAQRHRDARPWMTVTSESPRDGGTGDTTDPPRVVVLAQPIDASTQHIFEGMRDDSRVHVRIIDPSFRSVAELLDSDVLICSRQLRASASWISVAQALGMPVYFYLDDNLPLLRSNGDLDERWNDYHHDALREALSGLTGMIASSPALAESFRAQELHENVVDLPISAPGNVVTLRPPQPSREPAIAFLIGAHRVRRLRQEVLPAIQAIAAERGHPIRLIVPDPVAERLDLDATMSGEIVIERFTPSRDCYTAVRQVRDARPAVLVVPDSRTVNTPFKTLHPLLNAGLLATSLVVPATEPYLAAADEPGVVLVDAGSPDDNRAARIHAWMTALQRALPHPKEACDTPAVSGSVLTARFGTRAAVTALLEAFGELPRRVDARSRMGTLVAWYEKELALTRVQVDLQQREPQRLLSRDDAFGALLLDLHRESRTSRRLNALRRSPGPLQRFGMLARRGERVELSVPLTSVDFVSYPMHLERLDYVRLDMHVWASALPGDLIGIEVVHPDHGILVHTVAELPRSDHAVRVSFDTRALSIPHADRYDVRVFVRTNQPAHVLEATYRGRLGLRPPRVRLLAEWTTS